MSRLAELLRTARVMASAARYGEFFPPAGRRRAAAPLGTREAGPAARWLHPRRLAITRHAVAIPGLDRPVRVLHLTDLHLREDDAEARHVADTLSRCHADLVAITGDVVTRGWREPAVERVLAALPDAPLGRWAVMGNWEYWGGADRARWEPLLARFGVRLLHDRHDRAGPLRVAGTDDLLAGRPDLEAALPATVRHDGRPTLVLTHSPAIFPALAGPGVHLVLAGHSHGGQVCLPGLGAVWVPRGTGPYVAGWYERDGSRLFVSRGAGWSIAPLRWGCPAEIALIRLHPAPRPGDPAQKVQRQ